MHGLLQVHVQDMNIKVLQTNSAKQTCEVS